MKTKLRIVIADDEPDMREYFCKMLPRLGHEVVAAAANGRELVEHCRAQRPDLAITDIKMPELDGIEAAIQVYQDAPLPFILVSAYHDADLIARAEADHIMGYLVKPIKQADLQPAIALALRRFEQFQALRQEAADLRQTLEDRSLIERAKTILMKKLDLDEPSAFRRLQKTAMQKKKKLIEIAKTILAAEEILQASDAE